MPELICEYFKTVHGKKSLSNIDPDYLCSFCRIKDMDMPVNTNQYNLCEGFYCTEAYAKYEKLFE